MALTSCTDAGYVKKLGDPFNKWKRDEGGGPGNLTAELTVVPQLGPQECRDTLPRGHSRDQSVYSNDSYP